MPENTPRPVRIFIAYARLDADMLEELRRHLMPLIRSNRVEVWFDGEITPGAAWEGEIKKHLYQADIVLLLVSAHSIASDYFYHKEMTEALERHGRGEATVVPLILKPCAWQYTPLERLEAIPKNGLPVTEWNNRDAAWADAAARLMNLVERLEKRATKTDFAAVPFVPEMVYVRGGVFSMGSAVHHRGAYRNEKPQHTVHVNDYEIGKYPVTVAQFAAFVHAIGYRTEAELEGWRLDSKWEKTEGLRWDCDAAGKVRPDNG